MGCGSAREKLENEMILTKLERIGIQMERQNQIKLLEDIDGRKINVPHIPDYIDSKFQIKLSNKHLSNNNGNLSKVFAGRKKIDKRDRSKSVHIRKKTKSQETYIIDGRGKRKKSKKFSSKY